jgi:hypothetical protein
MNQELLGWRWSEMEMEIGGEESTQLIKFLFLEAGMHVSSVIIGIIICLSLTHSPPPPPTGLRFKVRQG